MVCNNTFQGLVGNDNDIVDISFEESSNMQSYAFYSIFCFI